MDADWDVFLSYAHEDVKRVRRIADDLVANGLRVWRDETEIADFEGITAAVERGLLRSRAMVAFYSTTYPTKRPCQWELIAAFIAAQHRHEVRQRVLVVNPEDGTDHIEPVELRDALFVAAEDPTLGARIARHVERLPSPLGGLPEPRLARWHGARPLGSARFVGRVTEMWALHSGLRGERSGLVSGARGAPLVQVRGLGGIGKSLLVEEYALRFGSAYPGGIFWLRPTDRAGQIRAFARDLGIPVAEDQDEEWARLAHALETRGLAYLWVVDGVAPELSREALEYWLGPGGPACNVITTRTREYGGVGTAVDLGPLTEEDAVQLLAMHTIVGADATGLVRDLGCHAQAVDVAGAALRAELGLRSIHEFREALAVATHDELELAKALGDLPNGYERSIAATLSTSVNRLGPAGLDFLRLAATLAPDPIPARFVATVFGRVDDLAEDSARERATLALREAERLSLADLADASDGSRRVHALVSRTVRFKQRHDAARDTALRDAAVAELTCTLESDAVALRSVAHARHISSPPRDVAGARLLARVAAIDYGRGDPRSAAGAFERSLALQRASLGDRHPDTLYSLDRLATIRREQGLLHEARALHDAALAARRETLGPRHRDTLGSLAGRALTYWSLGDLSTARRDLEHVVAAQREQLGVDDSDTLTTLANLAVLAHRSGEATAARTFLEEALDGRRRTLGDRHPVTLDLLGNLGTMLLEQGDIRGARDAHERVLAGREAVLGVAHPDTLASLANLADTLLAEGDLAGGRERHERALDGRSRVLGARHPDTLASLASVANARIALGDPAAARPYAELALDGCRSVLGDTHPQTRRSWLSLIAALHASGDLTSARVHAEEAAEVVKRALPAEHPHALETLDALARVYADVGEFGRSLELQQQVFDARRTRLGRDHVGTLSTLHSIAATQYLQGDLGWARRRARQALEGRDRALGAEHPETLASRHLLALVLAAQGELPEAAGVLREVIEHRLRVLGATHADTRAAVNDLQRIERTLDA